MGFVYKDRYNRWYVCYKSGGKRIAYVVSDFKKNAEMVLRRIQNEIDSGDHAPAKFKAELRGEAPTASGKTFGWPFGRFLKEYRGSKRKLRTNYYANRAPIFIGFFGTNTPLTEITPNRVEDFKIARQETCREGTVLKDLVALGTVFKWAERRGLWQGNPAHPDKVKRPPKPETSNRAVTNEEFVRLLDNSPGWLARIIRWACATGLDRGVVLSLRWVDLGEKPYKLRIIRPKNLKLIKQTLDEDALAVLAEARKIRHKDGIIFLNQEGQPVEATQLDKVLGQALKSADIAGITFRSFRHTFASRCVKVGTHPKMIGEMIGDTTASVVDTYMHTDDEMHEEAAAARSALSVRAGLYNSVNKA
ncbi:MAG: tyrosine-type recombinase/integrase [Acidobacteriota bacterium]